MSFSPSSFIMGHVKMTEESRMCLFYLAFSVKVHILTTSYVSGFFSRKKVLLVNPYFYIE